MADLREALSDAYDELDTAPAAEPEATEAPPAEAPDTTSAAPVEPTTETDRTTGSRPRDDSGRFTKADKKAPTLKEMAEAKAAPPKVADELQKALHHPEPTPEPLKPPQSLKAMARELWGKLGPEYRPLLEDIARREKETAQALQRAAEAGKGATTWTETLRPYEAQIRAAGQEPAKYVSDLLNTVHQLTYAPPQQKADLLANVIMQYGVSPQDLDQALVRRMNGQPMPAQQQAGPYRDPRVDQLFQTIEQQRAQREQAAAAEAEQTVSTFAEGHEFWNDVKDTVATILDSWGAQGKKDVSEHDLERAYNLACSMDEQVAGILEQRKEAKAAVATQTATQQAKRAAKSITTQPTAAPAAQPTGRRAALEAAYDDLASR